MLTDPDRALIAGAVAKAEAATSGEIVCVLARRVSTYREVPLTWAAAAALLLAPVALALGVDPLALARVWGGWIAGHGGALRMALSLALGGYALLQVVVFVFVLGLVSLPSVRQVLTPRGLKDRRVGQAAMAQLAAATLAAGPERAAVVIFASEDDRMVHIVASAAIHAKVGAAAWDQAVAAVLEGMARQAPAEGFVRAVQICGDALAAHFPHSDTDRNALSDEPLEI